ncbi:MAG: LysM peptidoglycan-binding domain-containing protein [Nitrospirota bacterium]|nr:LysM peptidoglycan-binding domain-containing protein [Nitrospirota bacterium]
MYIKVSISKYLILLAFLLSVTGCLEIPSVKNSGLSVSLVAPKNSGGDIKQLDSTLDINPPAWTGPASDTKSETEEEAGPVVSDNNDQKVLGKDAPSNPGISEKPPKPVAVQDEAYDHRGKNGGVNGLNNAVDTGITEEETRAARAQNFLDTALEFYEESQQLWAEGDPEKSIETLDQAYAFVLQVDPSDSPEMVQQIEDLRFMICKRIVELYASRFTTTNGNHNAIPLIMNEHVEKEIKRFQGREKKYFIESYKRSGFYREEIVKALKEAGLPEELSWLPLIESGFKVKALSRARALGLWQFIPSTGYKFGLRRDAWIDERLDPEKATAAAIAYLKELHQIFGDWTTVLAAYNCGEGRVLRVIRKQKVNYLDNFWDLYQMLPSETARYVPRFLATLHILRDPAAYGIELDEPAATVSYESVPIKKQLHLKEVARALGISYKELTLLNPELRYNATPGILYYLKVPSGMGATLISKLDSIPQWTLPQNTYTYHRVKKGETLSSIAHKYRTTVKRIARANNIRRTHFIRIGQKLKVPLKRGLRSSAVASSASLSPDGTYNVRKGDSLWLIANRFKMTTKKLQKLNGLKSTHLRIGQVLKIRSR